MDLTTAQTPEPAHIHPHPYQSGIPPKDGACFVAKPPEILLQTERRHIETTEQLFDWCVVDGIDIPYLYRDGYRHMSVSMIEDKLLLKYPNELPSELAGQFPIICQRALPHEACLLNRLIANSGNTLGGPYITGDLFTKVEDVMTFYDIVKTYCTERYDWSTGHTRSVPGGWLQLNSTVVPFLKRISDVGGSYRFLPLPVIQFGAGLLKNGLDDVEEAQEHEGDILSRMCSNAGFEFHFPTDLKLINLKTLLVNVSQKNDKVIMLNGENPFLSPKSPSKNKSGAQPNKKPYCSKRLSPSNAVECTQNTHRTVECSLMAIDQTSSITDNCSTKPPLAKSSSQTHGQRLDLPTQQKSHKLMYKMVRQTMIIKKQKTIQYHSSKLVKRSHLQKKHVLKKGLDFKRLPSLMSVEERVCDINSQPYHHNDQNISSTSSQRDYSVQHIPSKSQCSQHAGRSLPQMPFKTPVSRVLNHSHFV